jgi:hypothetical protein
MTKKSMWVSKCAGLLIAWGCSLAIGPASATIVTPTSSGTVTQTYAYTNVGGGDFIFSTTVTAPGCGSGWWIAATDPGYKSAVATVLAAQVAGSYLLIYADNSSLWSGSSSGQYCHVQTVGITS